MTKCNCPNCEKQIQDLKNDNAVLILALIQAKKDIEEWDRTNHDNDSHWFIQRSLQQISDLLEKPHPGDKIAEMVNFFKTHKFS